MAGFGTKTSREGERLVVALSGECDLDVRWELRSALAAAFDQGSFVIVDVSGLSFIDSSGIDELIDAYHVARQRGCGLYVRNGTGVAARVLEITGVGELLALPGNGDRGEG